MILCMDMSQAATVQRRRLHPAPWTGLVVWAAVAANASARAAVVYDNISSGPLFGEVTFGSQFAEFITLAGSGTTIAGIDTRIAMVAGLSTTTTTYAKGDVQVSFYSGNASGPGALLASFSQPFEHTFPTEFDDLPISFTNLNLPVAGQVWISVTAGSSVGAIVGVGLHSATSGPTVGAITSQATRPGPGSPWSTGFTGSYVQLRVNAVPAPGSLAVLALAGAFVRRRRRA